MSPTAGKGLRRRILAIGLPLAVASLAAAAIATWIDDGDSSTAKVSLEFIPQPPISSLNERTRRRLAPESRRIDLTVPRFSNPTKITNPLFPISNLNSALLLGKLEGAPWKAETTLLPRKKTVEWNGQPIETRESQFVAYLNGRIFEVAVDLYAQADDGSVWYFGEDAFTYERGRVVDTEGTWRAGRDGPPAMIMPGHPRVGDVYRTENIPGRVFEQVTIARVGETVNGPMGPVDGAIVGSEVHMDEQRLEEKTFAPGYGEFRSGSGQTFEATALAVPADALSEPVPGTLKTMTSGANRVFAAARAKNWKEGVAMVASTRAAWDSYRGAGVPKRLAEQMSNALDATARAVRTGKPHAAAQAALALVGASLDIQLRYCPPAEIDLARFDLQARRLGLDVAVNDVAAVRGDAATLDWIRDRLALKGAEAARIDAQLRSLDTSANARRLGAAAKAAARLSETIAAMG